MRAVLQRLLRLLLRIFFRRIEVAGRERVPPRGPVLFLINHPNALIDPLFLLCFAPRRVSMLGKAPLFHMPVIGWFARTLEAIPVHRRQDEGADLSGNRETFAAARALLQRGGTIAIAPEGTSHSDPRLRPLKTGAARIALGAAPAEPIQLVPAGLHYTAKGMFRSSALLYFGEPFVAPRMVLPPDGEPLQEAVLELTARIEGALAEVTLQADAHEALELVARAERILSASGALGSSPVLAEQFTLRRRLLDGYTRLRQVAPARLERLKNEVERLDDELNRARIDPRDVSPDHYTMGTVLAATGVFAAQLLTLIPVALPGILLHYPAYWLVGRLSRRVARTHDDTLATVKMLAGALLFPLTWVLASLMVGSRLGWPIGVAALLFAPVTGYAGLRLAERFDRFVGAARALGWYLFARRRFARLVQARERIRFELRALAEELRM